MKPQLAFQSRPSASQQADRHRDVVAERDEPRLTEAEAAERCCYTRRGCSDPIKAFQKWARRAGVPVERVGRARLYRWSILQAFLERKTWTVRHGRSVARPRLVRNSQPVDGKRDAR